MEVILVKNLCNIDNLTQNSSWKIILEKLVEQVGTDKEVRLDFKGINVVEPWTHEAFGEILKMSNIHFRFTSCNKESLESFVNKIKMRCIIEGLLADRIESVYIEPVKPKTKEELRIEKVGSGFIDKFLIEDGVATIEMYKIYDQIGSVETVESIIFALKKINETQGVNEFIVKIGRMFVQSNMLELLAKYIIELDEQFGITFKIDTDKEEYAKELGLHVYSAINDSYDIPKKIKAFMQIGQGTPGMLVKYKASRAVDQFGRNGKGQVVSNRIAIYRGFGLRNNSNKCEFIDSIDKICKDGVYVTLTTTETVKGKTVEKVVKRFVDYETLVIAIDSYNNNKFLTHAEWMTRNDGEIIDEDGNEITELPFDRVLINVDKLGLMNKFLGMQYHFIRAVQKTNDDTKSIIVDIDDNGGCITKKVTVPERMDIVFRDWDVVHDPIALGDDIEETNKILNK